MGIRNINLLTMTQEQADRVQEQYNFLSRFFNHLVGCSVCQRQGVARCTVIRGLADDHNVAFAKEMNSNYYPEPHNPTPAEMIMLLHLFMVIKGELLVTYNWHKLIWRVKSDGNPIPED